ncbi:MAG TPA: histidinol dehydrogenase [Chryseosolibacter sp.]|nr:histidinol dehydrogenase [Chryseosolibacter sp.]
MKVYSNPSTDLWKRLCERPQIALNFLDNTVRDILNKVKTSGDEALKEFTFQFDKVAFTTLQVTDNEIAAAIEMISDSLKNAIKIAAANIQKFHDAQKHDDIKIETMPGVTCWRKAIPIKRVGIYIPGGTAPLFSTVLMLGIPAVIAGCEEIILCTPPDKNGDIHPTILFTAELVGITKIYKVGGAQAIAAMAYGTETIPNVYKIFGPGNQYVTKAKQIASQDGVAIDMPAGPSEVLVLADSSASPSFIAADLLSQAEHGEDSQVMLVLLDESLLPAIQGEISEQIKTLPRRSIAEKALDNSSVIILNERKSAVAFVNLYAPEHLIINLHNEDEVIEQIYNAGSVFIGNYSAEAFGDYASGTNHTLPTNGYAKAFSGVSLDSFMKYTTYQQVTDDGLRRLGPAVEEMAAAEELYGHKNAITIRLKELNAKQ